MAKARAEIDGVKVYCRYDELVSVGDFKPHPQNPITHSAEQVERLAEIFKKNGIRKPITISKLSGYITAGHCRLKAAQLLGLSSYPAEMQDYKDKEAELADLIADNRVAELAEVDEKALIEALHGIEQIDMTGFSQEEVENLLNAAGQEAARLTLRERFLVPPFSVIQEDAEEWSDRREAWEALGFDTEKETIDPVLCEILYSWFSSENDKVVDPYAAGSARGIIAQELNRQHTDILDGTESDFDFCLSAPPDISKTEYPDFIAEYRDTIKKLYDRLNNDRFVAWVINEERSGAGNYYNFFGDTIKAFTDAGFNYYNEIVFEQAAGSEIVSGAVFQTTRKIYRAHKNVLVFVKGSGPAATKRLGDVQIKDFEQGQGINDESTNND